MSGAIRAALLAPLILCGCGAGGGVPAGPAEPAPVMDEDAGTGGATGGAAGRGGAGPTATGGDGGRTAKLDAAASDGAAARPDAAPAEAPLPPPPGGCPAQPPADTADPQVRDRCTRRIYVAGGDNFRVTVSVDEGKTWTRVQPVDIAGDDFINDISVGHGVVAIIGLPGLYTSTDGGQHFTLVPAVSHRGFDSYGGQIDFGAGKFVLTDNQGTYLSSDGVAWTSVVPFPDKSFPAGFGGHFHGRAYGGGAYVAFQGKGSFRTFDGAAWMQGTLPGVTTDALSLVYGGGKFVGAGGSWIVTSADGKTWTPPQTRDAGGGALGGITCVVHDGHQFIAYAGRVAFTSADGATWTRRALATAINLAVYGEGTFLGISGRKLLLSDDGFTWTSAHDLGADETNGINGPRLAIGRVLR